MFRTTFRRVIQDIARLQFIQRKIPRHAQKQIEQYRTLYVTTKCYYNAEDNVQASKPPVDSSLATDPTVNHIGELVEDMSTNNPFTEVSSKHLNNKLISRQESIEMLHDELFISRENAEKFFKKDAKLRYLNRAHFLRVIEIIKEERIPSNTVEQFPWILGMMSHNLRTKLDILNDMKPKKLEDFIPLLRISHFRLLKILCNIQNERDVIPTGNRIYYMAKKLEVPPQTIAKYMSRRLFMLEIPAQTLMEGLETMLEYGISPASILRDLWAFRYNTESMKERLERAKKSHKTKLMPWMVRCPEYVLQKSLRLAAEEKEILGENEDVYEYLSHRLGFDVESTKGIVSKHPIVATVRLTKIKEILDYLLDEAGFTRHEIAQVPRILSHSLETTKRRLDELKSYGCRPNSLVIVCKSKREYEKFVRAWLETRKKIQLKANKELK